MNFVKRYIVRRKFRKGLEPIVNRLVDINELLVDMGDYDSVALRIRVEVDDEVKAIEEKLREERNKK